MADLFAYAGLFASAFAAATVLPAQSEAVFAGLLLAGHPAWLLVAVAGTANTAGAVVNWFIGRGIGRRLLRDIVDSCTELGYRQMIAIIGDSGNLPSISLHRRLGFVHAGTVRSAGYALDATGMVA